MKELKGYEITFGLFSVSGFDDAVMESDTILVDKGEILKKRTLMR